MQKIFFQSISEHGDSNKRSFTIFGGLYDFIHNLQTSGCTSITRQARLLDKSSPCFGHAQHAPATRSTAAFGESGAGCGKVDGGARTARSRMRQDHQQLGRLRNGDEEAARRTGAVARGAVRRGACRMREEAG